MGALSSIERSAVVSACGQYRYVLQRVWDSNRPFLVFIMLNPSTADGVADDATIRVCMGRAHLMQAGGILILNLFAYRATKPSVMLKVADPIGPLNDETIRRCLTDRQMPRPLMVIAACGNDGCVRYRDQHVAAFVTGELQIPLYCLGTTKSGAPKHPLRISYAVVPQLWRTAA